MMVFNCKACGKPIVFITTVAGQTVRGRVLAPAADGGKLGRIPHWASCPGAAGLRKTRNPK